MIARIAKVDEIAMIAKNEHFLTTTIGFAAGVCCLQ